MVQPFRYVLPVVVLAALSGAACDIEVGDKGVSVGIAQGKATDEWVRSYSLPPGGRFEIDNINGGITVQASDGPQVEVRVERTARAGTDEEARAMLDAVVMGESVSPDHVRIDTGRNRSGPRISIGRSGVSLVYRVLVPAGLTMSFETMNGGIRLSDLDGLTTAATTNGGITGERLSGGVKATTINGGIRLEMVSVTDDIEASSTNGGVRLELPPDTRATLDAHCVNGGITVDSELAVDAVDKSRRAFTGALNGGGSRIAAATVNGGIRILARR
jgi:hypothetical protein